MGEEGWKGDGGGFKGMEEHFCWSHVKCIRVSGPGPHMQAPYYAPLLPRHQHLFSVYTRTQARVRGPEEALRAPK